MVSVDALRQFEHSLMAADRIGAAAQARNSTTGVATFSVIEELIVPSLERIGTAWEEGRAALSQVYVSGRICEELVDELLPPGSVTRKTQPRIAVAVLQDRHMLGKRIVYSVVRSAGYALSDYGSVTTKELVEQIARDRIDVVLISTLMLASALAVGDVRAALERIDWPVRMIVGGAPFRLDPQLWRDVGADAMGKTASDVLALLVPHGEELP